MKNNEIQGGLHKSVINWYPGHMAKTKKQIIEDLKLIDLVVEVLDARIPISSQNPDIRKIIQNKKRLVILNKSDLSNQTENTKWIQHFQKQQIPAVLVDSVTGKGIPEVIHTIESIYDSTNYDSKGRIGKSIRVMILGIPNVGKSSLINRLVKKNIAQVGNKPGVTRQKQWIKIGNKIELLDTPGVLWPKLNEKNAMYLAYTGTIKDDILEITEIGYQFLKLLVKDYKANLMQRYQLQEDEIGDILQNQDATENEKILEVMELIGKKRGALISGGEINYERVATILLDDFRSGKLGKITLEKIKE